MLGGLEVLPEELDEPVASADAAPVVRWRLAKVVGMSAMRAMEEKTEKCMVEMSVSSFRENGRLAHRINAV